MWVSRSYEMIKQAEILGTIHWLRCLRINWYRCDIHRSSYYSPDLVDVDFWPLARKISMRAVITWGAILFALYMHVNGGSWKCSIHSYLDSGTFAIQTSSSGLWVTFPSTLADLFGRLLSLRCSIWHGAWSHRHIVPWLSRHDCSRWCVGGRLLGLSPVGQVTRRTTFRSWIHNFRKLAYSVSERPGHQHREAQKSFI